MRFLLPLLVLSLVTPTFAADPVPPATSATASPGKTLANRLLALELEGTPAPELEQKLNALVEYAVTRFGQPQTGELEPAIAKRFFRSVDDVLLEEGVICPPGGRIELLRDALQPQQPTPAELQRLGQVFANARRSRYMQMTRDLGDPFYYFDCDLASILYLAVAERLGLPVFLVEAPGHNFVRWQSREVILNWDPNDGMTKSEQYFVQVAGVTHDDRILFGYLENRTPERILSYWLVRRGQRKVREGQSAAAVADFRAAVKTAPDDLVAANELAWLLATAPEADVRNGREAREIAEPLVARSRRINWLETLAAAWAETGDFSRAIAILEEARLHSEKHLRAANRPLDLPGFDACLSAYRQNLSYTAAKEAGLIK